MKYAHRLRVALYHNHSKRKQKKTPPPTCSFALPDQISRFTTGHKLCRTAYKSSRARGFIIANRTTVKASESRRSSLSNSTQFFIKLENVLACICVWYILFTCVLILVDCILHKQMHSASV